MNNIIGKLTEIEETASAIVKHAEQQKERLDQEYESRKRAFDEMLEEETKRELDRIRREMEEDRSRVLEGQQGGSRTSIEQMRREYEERHTWYAKEILRRITEV